MTTDRPDPGDPDAKATVGIMDHADFATRPLAEQFADGVRFLAHRLSGRSPRIEVHVQAMDLGITDSQDLVCPHCGEGVVHDHSARAHLDGLDMCTTHGVIEGQAVTAQEYERAERDAMVGLTKHTPGPWRTELTDDYDATVRVMDAQDVTIALVYQQPHDNWRAEDNARLLAEAPDLLDLLRRITTTTDLAGEDLLNIAAEKVEKFYG